MEGVVGNYNGWGATSDTPMTLGEEKDATGKTLHYLEANVTLAAGSDNGWKVRLDNDWKVDYGPDQIKANVPNKDGNFYVEEDGNYNIKWYFNRADMQLVVTKELPI